MVFFFIWFNWVLLLLYILDIKKQLCRTQFYFSVERFSFCDFPLLYPTTTTTITTLYYFPIPFRFYPVSVPHTYVPCMPIMPCHLYWNTYVYLCNTRVFPYLAHKSLLRKEHVRMFKAYIYVHMVYVYVCIIRTKPFT